nr:Chain B, S-arrestin [Bos taurus]
YGQEDIDVMGL